MVGLCNSSQLDEAKRLTGEFVQNIVPDQQNLLDSLNAEKEKTQSQLGEKQMRLRELEDKVKDLDKQELSIRQQEDERTAKYIEVNKRINELETLDQ